MVFPAITSKSPHDPFMFQRGESLVDALVCHHEDSVISLNEAPSSFSQAGRRQKRKNKKAFFQYDIFLIYYYNMKLPHDFFLVNNMDPLCLTVSKKTLTISQKYI